VPTVEHGAPSKCGGEQPGEAAERQGRHQAADNIAVPITWGATAKSNTHGPAENQMSTGFTLDGFPGIGSWVTYALGSDCQDLPAFVAIPDPRGVPQIGSRHWSSSFLPAVFQGTAFNADKPIPNLTPASPIGEDPVLAEHGTRDFLKILNDRHLAAHPGDSDLAARIAAYELAAKMQLAAAEVSRLDRESAATRGAYGIDDANKTKAGFGRNCLLAAPTRWAKAWATGTVTRKLSINTRPTARCSISPRRRSCATSSSAVCSTIRSSFSSRNSAECRRFKKARTGATTIRKASRSGSQARA